MKLYPVCIAHTAVWCISAYFVQTFCRITDKVPLVPWTQGLSLCLANNPGPESIPWLDHHKLLGSHGSEFWEPSPMSLGSDRLGTSPMCLSVCVQGTSWARPAWRSSFLGCLVTWLEQLSGPIRFRQMLLPKLAAGCNQHLSTLVTYCPFYYWTRVDPRYPYCPFCPLQSNHLQEVSLDHFSWFPCCSIAL